MRNGGAGLALFIPHSSFLIRSAGGKLTGKLGFVGRWREAERMDFSKQKLKPRCQASQKMFRKDCGKVSNCIQAAWLIFFKINAPFGVLVASTATLACQ